MAQAAEVIPFPLLADGLPVRPSPVLDPVLDATVACVARHGLAKTTMSDVARELGVAPSTVYRKVGSIDNAAVLVFAREAHRLLAQIPQVVAGVRGPRVITVFLAETIVRLGQHPMLAKMLRDEPDVVGRYATHQLDALLAQTAELVMPLFKVAMDAGMVRPQDPDLLASWVVRIAAGCVVAPPPGDLLVALDALLLPMLEPTDA